MDYLSDAEKLNKALFHTTNIAGGMFVGGISGARGDSMTSNLLISGGVGLATSGLNTLLNSHKFFSKDTLITTLTITASSMIMHLFTKTASDRRRTEPQIAFAPECPCKHKSWAERVSENNPASGMIR